MITVDDSGRQLTIHFGGGTLGVSSGSARQADVVLGLVKINQIKTAGTPGSALPKEIESVGSTIMLAFHNLEGLAVLENAIAKARDHLTGQFASSGDRNTTDQNFPVTETANKAMKALDSITCLVVEGQEVMPSADIVRRIKAIVEAYATESSKVSGT